MGNFKSNERPDMTRRALMVAVPLGSALALASGQHRADAAGIQASGEPALAADEQASGGGTAFQDLNGFMWFYSTYFGYKFTDINAGPSTTSSATESGSSDFSARTTETCTPPTAATRSTSTRYHRRTARSRTGETWSRRRTRGE